MEPEKDDYFSEQKKVNRMNEARYPLYEYKDGKKKIIWMNILKISPESLVFIVLLGILIGLYKHDTGVCQEVMEEPMEFCVNSNSCQRAYELGEFSPSGTWGAFRQQPTAPPPTDYKWEDGGGD
jgi:hypothetical protein|tara:strand:+ start:2015 stop:2386 length:372 start_codon:yes stop_codon:yes gene_type:complete